MPGFLRIICLHLKVSLLLGKGTCSQQYVIKSILGDILKRDHPKRYIEYTTVPLKTSDFRFLDVWIYVNSDHFNTWESQFVLTSWTLRWHVAPFFAPWFMVQFPTTPQVWMMVSFTIIRIQRALLALERIPSEVKGKPWKPYFSDLFGRFEVAKLPSKTDIYKRMKIHIALIRKRHWPVLTRYLHIRVDIPAHDHHSSQKTIFLSAYCAVAKTDVLIFHSSYETVCCSVLWWKLGWFKRFWHHFQVALHETNIIPGPLGEGKSSSQKCTGICHMLVPKGVQVYPPWN